MSQALFALGLDGLDPQLIGVRASEVARSLIARRHAPEGYEEGLFRIQAGIAESDRVIAQLTFDDSDVRLGPAMREDVGPPSIDPRLDSLSHIHAHDSRPSPQTRPAENAFAAKHTARPIDWGDLGRVMSALPS